MHQSVSTVIADLDQLQTQVNDLLAIAADVDDLDPQEKTNLVSSLEKKFKTTANDMMELAKQKKKQIQGWLGCASAKKASTTCADA